MLYQTTKWKEISYSEYKKELNKFEKRYDKLERLFFGCPIKKSLKFEFIQKHVEPGILNYINFINEIENFAIESDYNYYKDCGIEWILLGSEEMIENYKKLL